jgi:hypothetical protein
VSRGRRSRWIAAGVACLVLLTASAASAQLPPPGAASEPQPNGPARLAFSAAGTIYTIGADGSGRARVLDDAAEPTWSPDGGSIAFSRYGEELESEHAEIWVAGADGSAPRALTPRKSERLDTAPAWSPDGASIAFVRIRFARRGIVSTLMTVAPGGGAPRKVTEVVSRQGRVMTGPDWSADGKRLVVSLANSTFEEIEDPDAALYVVEAATGERRRLARNARDGSWSPDGGRVAFIGLRPDCEADECHELYTIAADGSDRRRLTTNEADEASPAWSPDGQRIALASTRNFPGQFQHELYTVRPDGSCLTWLTNGTISPYDPAWARDAGRSTDPGGCGAIPREPLIEPDLGRVPSFKGAPVWWVGPRFGNMLLSGGDVELGTAYMQYNDCASFEPKDCAQGFEVSSTPVCRGGVFYDTGFRSTARHEGAFVTVPRLFEDFPPQVYTGTTRIGLEGLERVERTLLDALRRFGEDSPPAEGLPRAQFPSRLLRTLERTRAAVRKHGSRGAARRLGTSRRRVLDRIALDRALRRHGPFGRLDCPS